MIECCTEVFEAPRALTPGNRIQTCRSGIARSRTCSRRRGPWPSRRACTRRASTFRPCTRSRATRAVRKCNWASDSEAVGIEVRVLSVLLTLGLFSVAVEVAAAGAGRETSKLAEERKKSTRKAQARSAQLTRHRNRIRLLTRNSRHCAW